MVLDLFTLGCLIRKNTRGYGTSGCTIVTWFVYIFMVIFSWEPLLFRVGPTWLSRVLAALVLTAYSSLCHIFIPMLHMRWLERKLSATR
jgi:hypothetical protein